MLRWPGVCSLFAWSKATAVPTGLQQGFQPILGVPGRCFPALPGTFMPILPGIGGGGRQLFPRIGRFCSRGVIGDPVRRAIREKIVAQVTQT